MSLNLFLRRIIPSLGQCLVLSFIYGTSRRKSLLAFLCMAMECFLPRQKASSFANWRASRTLMLTVCHGLCYYDCYDSIASRRHFKQQLLSHHRNSRKGKLAFDNYLLSNLLLWRVQSKRAVRARARVKAFVANVSIIWVWQLFAYSICELPRLVFDEGR